MADELPPPFEASTHPECPPCEHEGCDAKIVMVCSNFTGGEPDWDDEHFCPEHAPRHGYCGRCGDFWSGIYTFESSGYCDECWDDINDNGPDGDDDDYNWLDDVDL